MRARWAILALTPLVPAATFPLGYYNPLRVGGSSIAYFETNPLGEPLNVIVTGLSSPDIQTAQGFIDYFVSLQFVKECAGLHLGNNMSAFIDAKGKTVQFDLRREQFFPNEIELGACKETLAGGNHFRYWKQRESGAWFLAVSKQKSLSEEHDIIDDGYDRGRDQIVERASRVTAYNGTTYISRVSYITGLLPVGRSGINHGIAIDGRTAVITVTSSQGRADLDVPSPVRVHA